ncbi:MAG: heme-binding protein [Akkermansiaceae bacterium]
MKKLLAFLILTTPGLLAEEPAYVSEAPLPKGWPKPGPYNQVAEKQYPDYRVAVTKGGGTLSFWTLFNHIKKKDIPMTAPVEMGMEPKEKDMKKTSMGFLYQNTGVGQTGADGRKIQVKDVKKAKVLSYTWMGDDTDKQIAVARKALDEALAKKKVKAESFRLLGYNGPGTPRKNRTYELQALLPAR